MRVCLLGGHRGRNGGLSLREAVVAKRSMAKHISAGDTWLELGACDRALEEYKEAEVRSRHIHIVQRPRQLLSSVQHWHFPVQC